MTTDSEPSSSNPGPSERPRRRLLARPAVRRIIYGFTAIFIVGCYGVAGYLGMGWSFFDAIYQVVITISGVGFGEVRPLVSTAARIHTMLLIGAGTLSLAFTLGAFVQLLTENEILGYLGRQRMQKQIDHLTGHTIVAGYGRVGALVCDELVARGQEFVVIELDPERSAEVRERGFLCVTGDATEEKVLMEAGLEHARVIVSVMPNDAENVFITLTARQSCAGITVIARAEQPGTPRKLRQAGADHIVMPAAIGANRIVSLLTNPGAVEFAELVTNRSSVAIELDEAGIQPGSPLVGRSISDTDLKRKTGVIVVAIKREDGRLDFPITGDEILTVGDRVVILGRAANLEAFRHEYSVK